MKLKKDGVIYHAFAWVKGHTLDDLPAWLMPHASEKKGADPATGAPTTALVIDTATGPQTVGDGDVIVGTDQGPVAALHPDSVPNLYEAIADGEGTGGEAKAKPDVTQPDPAAAAAPAQVGAATSSSNWAIYRSHKIVRAARIVGVTGATVNLEVGEVPTHVQSLALDPAMFVRHTPTPGDYLVAYEDGYLSFSPKAAFEDGYHQLKDDPHGAGIGWAVKQMLNGSRVRRAGWNGKGMFLILVPGSTFIVSGSAPMGIAAPDLIGSALEYQPHVDMKTAQGSVVPWLASQSDLLALDWEIAA